MTASPEDVKETGGTEATTAEAAAILSITMAARVGDAVRALRAYGAARDAEWRAAVLASQHGITHFEGCGCEALRKLLGAEG